MKRVVIVPGASILGDLGGRNPQFLGRGRGRVVKYYILYHVQEVCLKVVTFEEK